MPVDKADDQIEEFEKAVRLFRSRSICVVPLDNMNRTGTTHFEAIGR
jgi:hypothetical protein